MQATLLTEIEGSFSRLSAAQQRRLLERLQRVHQNRRSEADADSLLAAMAADPQVQSEIGHIEQEFAGCAADGLERI